jgi:hypothetical protein
MNEKLNTAGKVSVVGHPNAPDGRYNFWHGKDGGWYISKDWSNRYSTYPIGEFFLRKRLRQNADNQLY